MTTQQQKQHICNISLKASILFLFLPVILEVLASKEKNWSFFELKHALNQETEAGDKLWKVRVLCAHMKEPSNMKEEIMVKFTTVYNKRDSFPLFMCCGSRG